MEKNIKRIVSGQKENISMYQSYSEFQQKIVEGDALSLI